MTKTLNGRNLRGWLAMAGWAAVIITLVVLLLSTGRTWGQQEATLNNHERRIERAEQCVEDIRQAMTEMRIDVGRIRTLLEEQSKPKESGP